MKDIQDWLELSSYATTANIYAHLDTDSKKQPATKMNQTVSITPGISAAIQAGGENSGREPGFKKKILRFSIHEKPEYFQLVPVVGLEPTRCRHQRILSPSRLPIPSHRHIWCSKIIISYCTTVFKRTGAKSCPLFPARKSPAQISSKVSGS